MCALWPAFVVAWRSFVRSLGRMGRKFNPYIDIYDLNVLLLY